MPEMCNAIGDSRGLSTADTPSFAVLGRLAAAATLLRRASSRFTQQGSAQMEPLRWYERGAKEQVLISTELSPPTRMMPACGRQHRSNGHKIAQRDLDESRVHHCSLEAIEERLGIVSVLRSPGVVEATEPVGNVNHRMQRGTGCENGPCGRGPKFDDGTRAVSTVRANISGTPNKKAEQTALAWTHAADQFQHHAIKTTCMLILQRARTLCVLM